MWLNEAVLLPRHALTPALDVSRTMAQLPCSSTSSSNRAHLDPGRELSLRMTVATSRQGGAWTTASKRELWDKINEPPLD